MEFQPAVGSTRCYSMLLNGDLGISRSPEAAQKKLRLRFCARPRGSPQSARPRGHRIADPLEWRRSRSVRLAGGRHKFLGLSRTALRKVLRKLQMLARRG